MQSRLVVRKYPFSQIAIHLTIIELTAWLAGWPCVWQPPPAQADVTVTKIAGYVRVRVLINPCVFSYFWHSYFLTYGQFVEYMNIYSTTAGLTKQCGSAHY